MATMSGRTIVVATESAAFAAAMTELAVTGSALIAIGCPDSETVQRINERGLASANAFAVGLSDIEAWQRIFAHVEQRLGPIDVLVTDCEPSLAVGIARLIEADLKARNFGGVVSTCGPLTQLSAPVRTAESPHAVAEAIVELVS